MLSQHGKEDHARSFICEEKGCVVGMLGESEGILGEIVEVRGGIGGKLREFE